MQKTGRTPENVRENLVVIRYKIVKTEKIGSNRKKL